MNAPYRAVSLGPVRTRMERREDGTVLLRADTPLGPYAARATERLLHWADQAPERVFLAQRDAAGEWERLTYAQAFERVQTLAQALLDRGLNAERPLMVLSENSLPHALLGLAAMHVGIPYVPVSPPYSLVSTDYVKLGGVLDRIGPGLVFAADGERFGRALREAVAPRGVEIVVVGEGPAGLRTTDYRTLLTTRPTPAIEAAHQAITPDTIAKVLFTSGSTGPPKGVINTHRMLTANAVQITQVFPFLAEEPPVLVDWLSWHHTYGGNKIFNVTLHNGGTLYIDGGRATPAGVLETVRNLREISPTVYFNIPKGFLELLPFLERDTELRDRFFARLRLLFSGAASLPQHVWDALERLSVQTTGERVVIASGLGGTESAPSTLMMHWEGGQAGLLGVPLPGTEIKLAPEGGKLEARYKGPNIMPGYWRDPAATGAAFDDEGFFRTGDALRLVDPENANRGLLFDGRIAEDFKLDTGTWVSVGTLRAAVIEAGAPLIQDAVITGHDRSFVAAVVFLNEGAAREHAGLAGGTDLDVLSRHPAIQARLQATLEDLRARGTGSANRIERLLVARFRPSLDAGEITDKGSLNQRGILSRHPDLVDELHADRPPLHVVLPTKEQPR